MRRAGGRSGASRYGNREGGYPYFSLDRVGGFTMTTRHSKAVFLACSLVTACLASTSAWSEAKTIQTLDQVKVFGGSDVLKMPFNDPYRESDQSLSTGISWPAGFVACKQTSAAGLICLTQDEWIVNWPDPSSPTSIPRLFSCNDIAKLLDDRAPNTCTGLTADESGTIWLAGKNKGKTHSLVKVTAGVCDPITPDRQNIVGVGGTFCGETWDTGRPLLLDVTRVEGEQAKRVNFFSDGEVVIGLEQRLNAVIFSATNSFTFIEIPGGRSGWNLDRKEELQSIALLQSEYPTGTFRNYVLVTTSNGKVKAKDVDNLAAPAVELRVEDNTSCTGTLAPQYAVRASPKGEIIYLTNRNCFRTVALAAAKETVLKLVPATESYFELDNNGEPSGPLKEDQPVPPLYSALVGPEGLTVAPGEDLSLSDCTGDKDSACRLVQGASLWNINFDGNPGVTLFQIKSIPDCRWIRQETPGVEPSECKQSGVIVDTISHKPGDPEPPAATQLLNVQPLLPQEVIDALEAKGITLPGQLLISPQYRGQAQNDYLFEAFFVAVDKGTTFSGTFDGEFDALLLAGAELGCQGTDGTQWDIVTKVSEKFPGVDGQYVDLLLNTGCGSSAIKSAGFSLFSYNLEVTPDTYLPGRTIGGVLDEVVEDNDAVFARLLGKLFYDLDYVANHYACASNADVAGSRPISLTKCTTLLSALANAGDKLGKCIDATYQPKQSASNQNCTSFVQQIGSFRQTLEAADPGPVGSDPANRIGELFVRHEVMMHVYGTRFVPSIPSGGFCMETDPGNCPRAP